MLWKAWGSSAPEDHKFLSLDAREPWTLTVGALKIPFAIQKAPLQNASEILANPLQVYGNHLKILEILCKSSYGTPLKILEIHCKSFKPCTPYHCVVVWGEGLLFLSLANEMYGLTGLQFCLYLVTP